MDLTGLNLNYVSLMKAVHLQARRKGAISCLYGFQRHDIGNFELWRFLCNEDRFEPLIGISAGIHGNEVSGPLALKHGLEGIIAYAARKRVGLIVYPCLNPSGFVINERYNADNEHPNNDCLRYRTKGGVWIDDAGLDKSNITQWCWSDDLRVMECPARETRLLLRDLHHLHERGILDRVRGWIDIHQDPYIRVPGSYAYVFGDRSRFTPTIDEVSQLVPILSNNPISSGYADQEHPICTDEHGLLTRYDGSIGDLMDNLYVPVSVTIETTTSVSLAKAIEVNWVWVKKVIDLCVAERYK